MNHVGTVKMETERLVLRRFVEDDADLMFSNWASDEKVTEYLRWQAHSSVDVTKNILNDWVKLYENKNFYQWAIVIKETGQLIGTISAVEVKEELNIVHVGYCIGRNWWSKGIVTEAFSILISFFFNKVAVNRIESQHDPLNIGSGRVMVKCGLQYEGRLRQADISNKGIVDADMYSILHSEYKLQK